MMRQSPIRLAVVLLVVVCSPAFADFVPYVELDPGSSDISLVVLPDGSGPAALEAQLFGGQALGAPLRLRILMLVWGGPGVPIVVPDYPAEDIWLQGAALSACPGGTCPDTNTDGDGWVQWTAPMAAGGHAMDSAPANLYVAGMPALSLAEPNAPVSLPWQLVSPDLTGDRIIDLADVTVFATAYFGTFDPAADFTWDGVLNLADVMWMGRLGANGCP